VYEIGAVPYRVARGSVPNKNDRDRIAKIVSFILMNLRQYVRPVAVPFEPVPPDAVEDPAVMDVDERNDDAHSDVKD
jgi:hypothetical protein